MLPKRKSDIKSILWTLKNYEELSRETITKIIVANGNINKIIWKLEKGDFSYKEVEEIFQETNEILGGIGYDVDDLERSVSDIMYTFRLGKS